MEVRSAGAVEVRLDRTWAWSIALQASLSQVETIFILAGYAAMNLSSEWTGMRVKLFQDLASEEQGDKPSEDKRCVLRE